MAHRRKEGGDVKAVLGGLVGLVLVGGLIAAGADCGGSPSSSGGDGGGSSSGGTSGSSSGGGDCAEGWASSCAQGSTCASPLFKCQTHTSTGNYQCYQDCTTDSDCEAYGAGSCTMSTVASNWCSQAPTSCTPLPADCTVMGQCAGHNGNNPTLYVCTGGAMPPTDAGTCSPNGNESQQYCCE
jgi:hypothetical protein